MYYFLSQQAMSLSEGAEASVHSNSSEQSWTSDDEESSAVQGSQTWSMAFEWQDGEAEDTPEALAKFEESTDFSQQPAVSTAEKTSDEADPADPDWVQPWVQSDADNLTYLTHDELPSATSAAQMPLTKPTAPPQPMSEEHKTAILGRYAHTLLHGTPCV